MSVRSAQSITRLFTTESSTGAAADADSTPTATLYVNGTANGATVTVTNVATGLYKAAVTLPTLSVGDAVELVVSATIGGTAAKAKIWEDLKDLVIDTDGRVDADSIVRMSVSGGTLTVYMNDGTTVKYTRTATGTAGADPITALA